VPENWVQHPVINTEAGTNPGAPLAWGSPENPDDAVAGYGYVPCDTSEVEETFYYHSDHLGSTSYITDQQANVTQYDAYLPYGELLVDEHSSSADLPYKFNGKELDEETGLYYYGARYMNPIASIWYGVDPLTEKYPNVCAFVYCMGNPVKLIDIDGMKPGDYYSKDGTWQGSDDINDQKVYVQDPNGDVSFQNKQYKLLDIKYPAFKMKCSTVYGESSAYKFKDNNCNEDLKLEMYAIAYIHTVNNPTAPAYGKTSDCAKEFRRMTDSDRNKSTRMRFAIAAMINALIGGFDYSYGATNWDGAEQAKYVTDEVRYEYTKGKFYFMHMNNMGWRIQPEHYAKWKKNIGSEFKAPQEKKATAGPNKGKQIYVSTAVYNRTIFWKDTSKKHR
jgi:RHS repeat-associated protein